jgi:hypothetical protein
MVASRKMYRPAVFGNERFKAGDLDSSMSFAHAGAPR